jgi:hypothetical protein
MNHVNCGVDFDEYNPYADTDIYIHSNFSVTRVRGYIYEFRGHLSDL